MLLCDVGNTSYHFQSGESHYKESAKTFNPSTIQETVYYICVNPHAKKVLKELENWVDLAGHVQMSNYYPTMGIDRIIACEAVEEGIIMDAGSAVTVDLVRRGVFEGGFIYPGLSAMQKSYTSISSVLEYPFNFDVDLTKLPKNSQDAISYGYLKTLYCEVNSHQMPLFLTGGDARTFAKIFPHAKVDEQLLFTGMKKIIKNITF
ncbi:type III pantothenate kinase [bacterium]|nr:type III pantothenate kinase [bacterium]MBU1994760.1 type III pantothenate kinase [bacterium]